MTGPFDEDIVRGASRGGESHERWEDKCVRRLLSRLGMKDTANLMEANGRSKLLRWSGLFSLFPDCYIRLVSSLVSFDKPVTLESFRSFAKFRQTGIYKKFDEMEPEFSDDRRRGLVFRWYNFWHMAVMSDVLPRTSSSACLVIRDPVGQVYTVQPFDDFVDSLRDEFLG